MELRHVVLRNPRLVGWEYGMLRALEDEIVRKTGASVIDVPYYGMHSVTKRVGHSMRWDPARKVLPKKSFRVEADVIWYILMGPENYELDLFRDWDVSAKYRIAYIYDTLEPQFGLTKKLFSNDLFNIRITSFNDAAPFLEQLTGKPWFAIEQAVPEALFKHVSATEKTIAFSSYGRRLPVFHSALLEFCKSNDLYYDYTTHDGKHPTAPESELYGQYAWHISHSTFTVSWPVELTNPIRAGRLHPITCRWFEAASAGTIILGRKPNNEMFDKYLARDLVVDVDPYLPRKELLKKLETLYTHRLALQQKANDIMQSNATRWTWNNRVQRMLQLLK